MMGTLASAGSLKFDCLTKTGAQLQSWLFSRGTAFCRRNKIGINLDKLGVKNIPLQIKNNMDKKNHNANIGTHAMSWTNPSIKHCKKVNH